MTTGNTPRIKKGRQLEPTPSSFFNLLGSLKMELLSFFGPCRFFLPASASFCHLRFWAEVANSRRGDSQDNDDDACGRRRIFRIPAMGYIGTNLIIRAMAEIGCVVNGVSVLEVDRILWRRLTVSVLAGGTLKYDSNCELFKV